MKEPGAITFDASWSARRHRLLSGRALQKGAFKSRERRIALPFGLLMTGMDHDVLLATIQEVGDDRLGVTGLRREFDDQPDVVVRTAVFDPQRLATSTVLGRIEVALFGPSETWTIACSPDGFSALTASPHVFDRFASAFGGESVLRARLDRSIEEGEFGSPGPARAGIERILSI